MASNPALTAPDQKFMFLDFMRCHDGYNGLCCVILTSLIGDVCIRDKGEKMMLQALLDVREKNELKIQGQQR